MARLIKASSQEYVNKESLSFIYRISLIIANVSSSLYLISSLIAKMHQCCLKIIALYLSLADVLLLRYLLCNGKLNHVVVLTCGLILLYTTVETHGIGYVITAAECDLQLTVKEKGMINAAFHIGVMITAMFWGYLGDLYGRRSVMLPAIIAGSAASILSSLSFNFWTLFLSRLFTGCLVSAANATVYAYLGELHCMEKRQAAIALGAMFIGMSFIMLSGLAWLILSKHWHYHIGSLKIVPWRVFVCTWCTPGVIASCMLVFLPESPRYLMASRGAESALPVLARIYAINNKKSRDDYPVKSITTCSSLHLQHGFKMAFRNIGECLKPPLLRCIIISHFCLFTIFLLASSIYMWMPDILNETLHNVQRSVSICNVMTAKYNKPAVQDTSSECQERELHHLLYPVSMTIGVSFTLFYLLVRYLISTWGKVNTYRVIILFCTSTLATAALVPQPYVALVMFGISVSCGSAASVVASIAVDVFPTSVRALALCTLYMMGRLGGALGSSLLGYGMQKNCMLIFLIITIGAAVSTAMMFLWPDSKQIRADMEKKGFCY